MWWNTIMTGNFQWNWGLGQDKPRNQFRNPTVAVKYFYEIINYINISV